MRRRLIALILITVMAISVLTAVGVTTPKAAVSVTTTPKADARVPTRLTLRASPITAVSCVKRLVCLTRLIDDHGRRLHHKPIYLYRAGYGPIAMTYTDSCGSAVFCMPCATGPTSCWSYWYYAVFRGDAGYSPARSTSERPVWLG